MSQPNRFLALRDAALAAACAGAIVRFAPGWTGAATVVLAAATAALSTWMLRPAAPRRPFDVPEELRSPNHRLLRKYPTRFYRGIVDISARPDRAFLGLARARLEQMARELEDLSRGVVRFDSADGWWGDDKLLLRHLGLFTYRSVVWLGAHEQADGPRLAEELQDEGWLDLERVVILPEAQWSEAERLPADEALAWIDEQHRRGVRVSLLQETSLGCPARPACELRLYGDRAVGILRRDLSSGTDHFAVSFEASDVQHACSLWRELVEESIPYGELLGRAQLDA